jgi:hypothetical protein
LIDKQDKFYSDAINYLAISYEKNDKEKAMRYYQIGICNGSKMCLINYGMVIYASLLKLCEKYYQIKENLFENKGNKNIITKECDNSIISHSYFFNKPTMSTCHCSCMMWGEAKLEEWYNNVTSYDIDGSHREH